MNDPQKLNYETPRRKPIIRIPPDWRRRLVIAAVAVPVVLLVTLEASRRTQSSAVSHMQGGGVNVYIREIQNSVDAYVKTMGSAPVNLTDAPENQQRAATDPGYLIDPWGTPYLLKSINGKPVVISHGRDKLPGGIGLDADTTVNSPYGSDPVTMSQFIRTTNLLPVILICMGNALLVAILAFTGTPDTRQPRGLWALLLQLGIQAAIALFVASMIAAVHAPSGH